MTTRNSTRSRTRALGVSWLALGVPVGIFLGWLLQMSDHKQERAFGAYLLALGMLALWLGLVLVRRSRPELRGASLGASGLWVLAAVAAVALFDHATDRLWLGGLTGLVAVVTGALALAVQP